MNQTHKAYTFPSGQSLQIIQGDIASEIVDAIVNAANSCLKNIRLALFDQEILLVFLIAWEHDDHFCP